jgi:hypothetical protein
MDTKMCISSHAPSSKHQITVRFTGHLITLDSWYGTCFMSSFWCLQFGSDSWSFEKSVYPYDSSRMMSWNVAESGRSQLQEHARHLCLTRIKETQLAVTTALYPTSCKPNISQIHVINVTQWVSSLGPYASRCQCQAVVHFSPLSHVLPTHQHFCCLHGHLDISMLDNDDIWFLSTKINAIGYGYAIYWCWMREVAVWHTNVVVQVGPNSNSHSYYRYAEAQLKVNSRSQISLFTLHALVAFNRYSFRLKHVQKLNAQMSRINRVNFKSNTLS